MDFLKRTVFCLILTFCLNGQSVSFASSDPRDSTNVLSYKITSNLLSQNCEFYVDSFGDAHDSGLNSRWLEAQVRTKNINNSGQNRLLTTGVYVEYIVDAENSSRTEIFLQQQGNPYFLHQIPYSDSNPNEPNYKRIAVFNFFIDVMTPNRDVIRYWLSSKPYTFQATFWGYPYRYVDRGNGVGITYTQFPSPVLERKKTCAEDA